MSRSVLPACSYVVPFRRSGTSDGDLAEMAEHFRRITAAGVGEIVVVDGSPPGDFALGRHLKTGH